MVIKIEDIFIGALIVIAFGPVMEHLVFPFFGAVGSILSNLYKVISKPIRKLCAAFDKWNNNPPKKDFESF